MMQDKPLDPSERTLLKTIAELQAVDGSVGRDALSVATRGRGVEFGRSYARIKSLGLIVETSRRAPFLRRLFGAPTLLVVHLTEAGRMALSEMAAPRAPEPPLAPLAESVEAASEPELVLDVQDPTPSPSPRAPAKPVKRRAVVGFTEELGGTPMPPATAPRDADPDAIEALREVLSGLGIDLTMAGEMLATQRIAEGHSGAEALVQVILYTFAHAVHQDLTNGRATAAMGLAEYAVEVHRELQKLSDAGAISAARFAADMDQLSVLMSATPDAARLAATLLQDPYGGAAPPAVLPEELRSGPRGDGDDDDSF